MSAAGGGGGAKWLSAKKSLCLSMKLLRLKMEARPRFLAGLAASNPTTYASST